MTEGLEEGRHPGQIADKRVSGGPCASAAQAPQRFFPSGKIHHYPCRLSSQLLSSTLPEALWALPAQLHLPYPYDRKNWYAFGDNHGVAPRMSLRQSVKRHVYSLWHEHIFLPPPPNVTGVYHGLLPPPCLP